MEGNKSPTLFLLMGICGLVAAITLVSFFVGSTSYETRLSAQAAEINRLESEIRAKTESNTAEIEQNVQSATGLNAERVRQDSRKAEAFLQEVMTWDSWAKYNANRQRCIGTYGLDPESRFMQVFLPEVPTRTSADGTVYNRIDVDGLNARYEKMSVYTRGIAAGTYSYFAYVTWSTRSTDGYEGISTCIFLYDVDSSGNLLNMDAYTVPGRL